MKFKFLDYLSPSPVIQEKKKYATFTLREIGGQAEIVKWREEQATKWAAYQANREAFKEKQKLYVCGPDAPQGDKVTWEGKASLVQGSDREWHTKLAQVIAERERLYQPEVATAPKAYEPYVPEPKPKLSLWAKTKNQFSRLWNSANFS